MAEIVSMNRESWIDPETVAKCEAKFPLNSCLLVQILRDDIEIERGRRDLIAEATRRAIEGLIWLYDRVADADQRKGIRATFRQMMTRQRTLAELLAPIRTRLGEHKMFVMCGLDPPDPDERRKGKRDDAA